MAHIQLCWFCCVAAHSKDTLHVLEDLLTSTFVCFYIFIHTYLCGFMSKELYLAGHTALNQH